MSVDKWAYEPGKCDTAICPGDCDLCDLKDYEPDDEEEEQEIMAARKGEE